jgi:hypothetical protein
VQVERHWREWNQCLVSYYDRFQLLEAEGHLHPTRNLDLFCLHSVFLPAIKYSMKRHYESLKMQKKRKSTKNPDYPNGTHRRSHLYTMMPSMATRLTQEQARRLRDIGFEHWLRGRPASLDQRPWEVDPVSSLEGREIRAQLLTSRNPATEEEEYRVFRRCTIRLSARGM